MPDNANEMLPLPDLTFHVLLALAEGPRHGWAVIKRIEELTAGRKAPSSGSLYLAIVRMEDRGLLEEIPPPAGEEGADSRRRYHRLTSFGRRVLEAESHRLVQLLAVAAAAGIETAAVEGA